MELLAQDIVTLLAFVPGLNAIVDLGAKEPKPLSENERLKGISIEEASDNRGLVIKIGIFVDPEVKAATVVSALSASIKAIVAKRKMHLAQLLVIIRGVK